MAETKAKPAGTVYRWIGTYAQEFEGPNQTTQFAGPGDYVELDINETTPLAEEFLKEGLLIEAPGYEAGPAISEAMLVEEAEEPVTESTSTTTKGGK